jgi:drug/metabolite transporter (DMT)-like permease
MVGAIALVLWSTLPTLAAMTEPVPPFQVTAMAFSVAFVVALASWRAGGGRIRHLFAWPLRAWAIGLFGLFGYHFCYFMAMRHAPPAEASLINHLWPVMIVVFSAFLPGERLRWWHVAGVLAGLAGAGLLVTGGGSVAFQKDYAVGYALALACAIIWSTYSLLNRVFARDVSSHAVGAFCAGTAVLAGLCHLAFEATVTPSLTGWLVVLGLGLGPIGIAFFVWDYGCKRGDIQILGALAYFTPLFATALLILAGRATPSWALGAACLLIAGGAALASRTMLTRRSAGDSRTTN